MRHSRTSYLTEGVILALATIAAYSFVYSYEKGICDFYGLPPEVITIGLWQSVSFVVKALAVISSLFVFVYFITFVYFERDIGKRITKIPRTIISKWVMAIVILVAYLWFGNVSLGFFVMLPILLLFMFMLDFGVPYFTRGEKTWIDRIKEVEEAEWKTPRLWDKVPNYIYVVFLLIYGLNVGNNVVASAGAKFAANRVQYPTLLQDGETYAILRVYGDRFYASLYDEDSKKLLGKFTAFEAVGHEWEMANVGPLEKHEVEKEVKELAMSHADKNVYGRWEVNIELESVKKFDEFIKDKPLTVTRTSIQDALGGHQLYEFADDTDGNILESALDEFFRMRK